MGTDAGPLTAATTFDAVAKPRERVLWLDATRGIGIILVVYGHALRGQVASHAYPETPAILFQDMAIYSFHMPLFFFLSGLFVDPLMRMRPGKSVYRLFWNIIYPYFLWSIVQIGLNIAATQWVNTPIRIEELWRIPWEPVGQFWFLYALFLCQLLAFLPRPIFYAIALMTCFVLVGPQQTIVIWAEQHLPYFPLGVWISAGRTTALLAPRGRAIALGVAAALLFTVGVIVWRDNLVVRHWYPFRIMLAVSGILVTLVLARLLASPGGLLERLGRASMPIYLMHVIAAAALRTVLGKVPGLPPYVALILVFVFGLAAPYLAARMAVRWRIDGWLGFGGGPRARLGAAA